MGEVAKDLASGTVAGICQLLVGHPFDTIKVKLQSQPRPLPGQPALYAGAIDATKKTIAAEGPLGLYKGMGAPLASVAVFNAVLFTARGQMEALLRKSPDQELSMLEKTIAGAGAGVAVSFVACPTELIKCRLQAGSTSGAVYNGPFDVAKHVIKSEGGVVGLFRGFVPTVLREAPGNAAMFGAYELTKRLLAGKGRTEDLGQGALMVAGGVGGATFWASVYPMDVAKSMIQVDNVKSPKYRGTMDALAKTYEHEGLKGLYRGFGPAMVRSVPANAVCFLAYEYARKAMG